MASETTHTEPKNHNICSGVIEQLRLSTHCTELPPETDSQPKRKAPPADARAMEG